MEKRVVFLLARCMSIGIAEREGGIKKLEEWPADWIDSCSSGALHCANLGHYGDKGTSSYLNDV